MNVNEITQKDDDYRQVKIVIGGDGVEYSSEFAHFEVTGVDNNTPGLLVLCLPDSVAEYFRMQGRKRLQDDFRKLLNSARA